jgi:hypothetical protein
VAHRLLARDPASGRLRLRGDAMPHDDPPVEPDAVLGALVAVQRGSRRLDARATPFRLAELAFPRSPRWARRLLSRIAARLTPGKPRR